MTTNNHNPDHTNHGYNNAYAPTRPKPSEVNPVPPQLRDQICTIAQAATLLNTHRDKVRRMIANGYIRVDSRIYHYNRFIKLLNLDDVKAVQNLLQANPTYIFVNLNNQSS